MIRWATKPQHSGMPLGAASCPQVLHPPRPAVLGGGATPGQGGSHEVGSGSSLRMTVKLVPMATQVNRCAPRSSCAHKTGASEGGTQPNSSVLLASVLWQGVGGNMWQQVVRR